MNDAAPTVSLLAAVFRDLHAAMGVPREPVAKCFDEVAAGLSSCVR